MKKLSLRLLLLLGSATALPSVSAVVLTQIEGEHTVYFYDADFWGADAATVVGDAISFKVRPDFAVSATVRPGTTTASQLQQSFDFGAPGVVAVAKDGYNLKNIVGSALTGSFTLAASGSQVDTSVSGSILAGSVIGNVFMPTGGITGYTTEFGTTSIGAPHADTFNTLNYVGNILPYMKTIGVETYLTTYVRQVGSGTAGISLDRLTYQFAVVAIPEPATYAMWLGGGVLLAFMRRRRPG